MKTLTPLTKLALIVAVIAMAVGCKPRIEGELGEPFDKIAGIAGMWELNRFIQRDMNNPIKEERDHSQFYIKDGYTPLRLTFTPQDRSYNVDIETGRNYFGESGTWKFDDDVYPTFIILTTVINGEETELPFKLGRMVREFDHTLLIELARGCDLNTPSAVPTVVYRFEFNRITQ